MLLSRPVAGSFGFSLNPAHYLKKGAVAVGHEAKAGGKFVVHHAGSIAELAVLPIAALNKVVVGPILHAALTPVRHKVDELKDRRAKKLAWDRRKSPTPTPAERNEAKSWTKTTLRHEKIPFGPILSLLAGTGPTPPLFGGLGFAGSLGDPTTATIISSIPVLLAIMKSVLSKSNGNGQAPANPQGGATAPAAPGTVDLAPAQDAGAAAAAAAGGDDAGAGDGADAGGGGGGKGKGKGGHGKGGHGGGGQILGMPKKYVIIGGAVLGGVLVLSLLTSKKG